MLHYVYLLELYQAAHGLHVVQINIRVSNFVFLYFCVFLFFLLFIYLCLVFPSPGGWKNVFRTYCIDFQLKKRRKSDRQKKRREYICSIGFVEVQ